MKGNITTLALAILAAGGLAACSSGSSDSSSTTGTLSVGLIDKPVFGADEIQVCITQINVKPEQGPPLEFPLEPDSMEGPCDGRQIDLLTLTSVGNAEMLIQDEAVEAGPYEWIELELDAARPGGGTDADGNYDSYVLANGSKYELRMPSGSVRLVNHFTVTAGQHTQFTLDWDAQRGLSDQTSLSGLTNPMGFDGYILRPAFRIVDETVYGTVNGTVQSELITDDSCLADNEDVNVGNVVYVFAADGLEDTVEPDDTDGIAPDAYATIDVEQNEDGAYVYETIIAPGDYRFAFTCQGDADSPDVNDNDTVEEKSDVEFIDPDGSNIRTITEDETTTVDFSVPAA
jgi:hypothetical protein